MLPHNRLIPALALFVISSCASGGNGSTASGTRGPRNELTRAQMLETNTANVYDAIRRLRSDWLRIRGATSTREGGGGIVVYVDGVRAGGVDRLEQITLTQVVKVRYVGPSDATTRWGTGHSAGVIEVLTR